MREIVTAMDGRNQRHLNLETEISSKIPEKVVEKTKIRTNLQWAAERERLTAIVDLGKQIPDLPESEKAANVRELYDFLKRPFEEVQSDRPTAGTKRNRISNDVDDNYYLTPS